MFNSEELGANSTQIYSEDNLQKLIEKSDQMLKVGAALQRLQATEDWKLVIDDYILGSSIEDQQQKLIYADNKESREHETQNLISLLALKEKLKLLPTIVASEVQRKEDLENLLMQKQEANQD